MDGLDVGVGTLWLPFGQYGEEVQKPDEEESEGCHC
jgi:hypothetical protein